MRKAVIIIISLFIIGFVILPNVFNTREKAAFSSEIRLAEAMKHYSEAGTDSVKLSVSTFYDRGELVRYLLGTEYRDLWQLPVSFPVWNERNTGSSFVLGDIGGGEQTTSVDVTSDSGYVYTLRSVAKDQSGALPEWLYFTLARPLFRDQASSLNPYAAPVVAALSESAGIPHMNPSLYYIPFSEQYTEEENLMIAGRVMLMEEEPDKSWNYSDRFGKTTRLLKTSDMLILREAGKLWVDTALFARCRIFDILISDWDRHERQWAWACDTLSRKCSPIPVDRDMAFYTFNEGAIDRLALLLVPKFQSFDRELTNLEGYLENGGDLQATLLSHLTLEQWRQEAKNLKRFLTEENIRKAFGHYPPDVRSRYGEDHARIMIYRTEQSENIATFLYESMH